MNFSKTNDASRVLGDDPCHTPFVCSNGSKYTVGGILMEFYVLEKIECNEIAVLPRKPISINVVHICGLKHLS